MSRRLPIVGVLRSHEPEDVAAFMAAAVPHETTPALRRTEATPLALEAAARMAGTPGRTNRPRRRRATWRTTPPRR